MKSILIVDSCDEFREGLREALQDQFTVYSFDNGADGLAAALEIRPDNMVVNLILPQVDGLTLLQTLQDSDIHPVTLALSRFTTEFIEEKLMRLGAGYLMLMPCKLQAVVDRLVDLVVISAPKSVPVECWITKMLLDVNVPVHRHGYVYIREAIHSLLKDPSQLVTKELYPGIGKQIGASDTQVEKNIRITIQAAWKNRDPEAWSKTLGLSGDRCPTNSEFLFGFTERLRLKLG